jgi:hypothetical protein
MGIEWGTILLDFFLAMMDHLTEIVWPGIRDLWVEPKFGPSLVQGFSKPSRFPGNMRTAQWCNRLGI